MKLPYGERVMLEPGDRQLFSHIEAHVDSGGDGDGYAAIATDRGLAVLFFRAGRTYCAGEFIDGHFASLGVTAFMRRLPSAQTADYYGVDLSLFVCTAVLFRKAPTTSLALDALGAQAVLDVFGQQTRDAVVAIRRGDVFTLVLCRKGHLDSVHSADPAYEPSDDLEASLVAYVERVGGQQEEIVASLYTDIELPPASDAGLPVAPLDEDEARSADLALLIKLSGRPVFHYAMSKDQIRVGRGPDNDVALDSVSVSRRHAKLTRHGMQIHVEDLGGENGIIYNGERVTELVLEPGEEIVIGTYSLFYSPTHDLDTLAAQPVPRSSPEAAMAATMAIGGRGPRAAIIHGDRTYPIRVPVFIIGTSQHAHIRLAGFLVAPTHLEIERVAGGRHHLRRTGRWRRLFLAGASAEECALENGTVFTLAGQRFQYVIGNETPSSSTSDVLESPAKHA